VLFRISEGFGFVHYESNISRNIVLRGRGTCNLARHFKQPSSARLLGPFSQQTRVKTPVLPESSPKERGGPPTACLFVPLPHQSRRPRGHPTALILSRRPQRRKDTVRSTGLVSPEWSDQLVPPVTPSSRSSPGSPPSQVVKVTPSTFKHAGSGQFVAAGQNCGNPAQPTGQFQPPTHPSVAVPLRQAHITKRRMIAARLRGMNVIAIAVAIRKDRHC